MLTLMSPHLGVALRWSTAAPAVAGSQTPDLSAVRHIAPHKGIPPFLILHVADHTDTSAQAHRLWSELQEAKVPAKIFGAAGTDHVRLDHDLGVPGDPSTAELFAFVESVKTATLE